jgi:hypothetical protein
MPSNPFQSMAWFGDQGYQRNKPTPYDMSFNQPRPSNPYDAVAQSPTPQPSAFDRYKQIVDPSQQPYRKAMMELLATPPERSNPEFAPTKTNRLGAFLTGFAGGFGGDVVGGIKAAQGQLNSKYNDAMIDFNTKVKSAASMADIEASDTDRNVAALTYGDADERDKRDFGLKQTMAMDELANTALDRETKRTNLKLMGLHMIEDKTSGMTKVYDLKSGKVVAEIKTDMSPEEQTLHDVDRTSRVGNVTFGFNKRLQDDQQSHAAGMQTNSQNFQAQQADKGFGQDVTKMGINQTNQMELIGARGEEVKDQIRERALYATQQLQMKLEAAAAKHADPAKMNEIFKSQFLRANAEIARLVPGEPISNYFTVDETTGLPQVVEAGWSGETPQQKAARDAIRAIIRDISMGVTSTTAPVTSPSGQGIGRYGIRPSTSVPKPVGGG